MKRGKTGQEGEECKSKGAAWKLCRLNHFKDFLNSCSYFLSRTAHLYLCLVFHPKLNPRAGKFLTRRCLLACLNEKSKTQTKSSNSRSLKMFHSVLCCLFFPQIFLFFPVKIISQLAFYHEFSLFKSSPIYHIPGMRCCRGSFNITAFD